MSQPVLVETLIHYLQPLKLLVVLDNCEHLLTECARLAESLLRACPGLTILATSRQGLGIDGETCWRVPSLSLPRAHAKLHWHEIEQFESVRLFVDRARERRSDFALTPENAGQVAQLCFRLDGIPLAIELAAARIRVLSVEQIIERLDERFRLLSSPNQSVLPRHKTLGALMDWSYDLLSESERALFRGLSVFAGGFALDAVYYLEGGEPDEFAILDLLSQLVDKSLVLVDEVGGAIRYHMLETIRQYAWKKGVEESEEGRFLDRHLDWCVTLAEHTEDELVSNRQALWLDRLEAEHDNLRAALTYTVSLRPEEKTQAGTDKSWMGLRLAGALVWFWYFRGYVSEGRSWLERALDQAKLAQRDVALAKVLSAAGVLAYIQSDYMVARERLEESLAIWNELQDKRGTAFALTFLGRVLAQQGDPRRTALGERSVELFRTIGDRWGLALSLDFLGEEARQNGQSDIATALHQESLALYRELGHRWGIALELSHFAQVSLQVGDYSDARRRLEQAVAIQRSVGDKSMLAWNLNSLGDLMLRENEVTEAEALYQESLALFSGVEHRGGLADTLHKLATIALSNGNCDLARTLSSESLDLNRGLHYPRGVIQDLLQLGSIAQQGEDYKLARSLYRDALTKARALGSDRLIIDCIINLAALQAAQEQWEMAALLLGVAGRAGAMPGETDSPLGAPSNTALAGAVSAHLGNQSFEVLHARGQALTQAEGISLALHDDPAGRQGASTPAVQQPLPTNGKSDANFHDKLTGRELEVLRLIAEGLTDAQIANRLVLSTRTVQAHVRAIYGKLGIATRSAATRYAIQRGYV